MRILHVIASANPEGGGPIEGVRQRGVALREMGHSIEIACCDDPASPWLVELPFPVHPLGPGRGGYEYAPRLEQWLRERASSYDGVVVNGIWQFHGRAVWHVMRAVGKPYVVFTHGMLDPWFNRKYPTKHLKKIAYWLCVEHRVLRSAAFVLFTSEEERVLARQSFRPYHVNERVVRYGVRGPQGDPDTQRQAFLAAHPELGGKRVLLFLSRIHPKKGCDLLIEAFATVAREDPCVHLVMAGPDQVGWRAELERQSTTLGIADRITWPGMVEGDDKWGAFHACDAFVLPSHQENFGIVVVEALACGRPVLITNKVNIWREIRDADAGWIMNPTVGSITNSLREWLATDTQSMVGMGTSALECFRSSFAVHSSAQSLLQVLEDATINAGLR